MLVNSPIRKIRFVKCFNRVRTSKPLAYVFVGASFVLAFSIAEVRAQEKPADGGNQKTSQFDRWDKNKDGKLTRDELPQALRRNFDRVDRNKDGFISKQEDMAFRKNFTNRNPREASYPKGTKVLKDLVYVEDGHQRHRLDLYLPPKSQGTTPLIVWVHGGGWRAGDKRNCPATVFLADGFAVASVNYRLSHHAVFPAQIQDCKAAIRWLRSNAGKHNLDEKHIGVWGSSAGGHLVALLGTSGDVDDLESSSGNQDVSSRVQAVCDYFGPTALLKMNKQAGAGGKLDHDSANSPESKLLGGSLQTMVKEARKANPMTYVTKDDPPFLIVHGDKDPLVPLAQSEELNELLKKTGVASELVVVPGGGHGGFREAKYVNQVRAFFAKHLK